MRAGRPPSETRRRVCHLSSGDQHRSSKKDSSVGEAGCGLCEYGRAGCVRCGEASVKARYLHGVSARHRSWYESGSSSASKGGAVKQGGGRGRAALGGADFSERATARVLHVRARGKAPCQGRTLACSAAAVGAGWTGGPEERGRGCSAAPGERAEEGGGQRRGLRNLMWYWVPSSSRERRRDPGVRPCPSPTPPHRAPTRGRAGLIQVV